MRTNADSKEKSSEMKVRDKAKKNKDCGFRKGREDRSEGARNREIRLISLHYIQNANSL